MGALLVTSSLGAQEEMCVSSFHLYLNYLLLLIVKAGFLPSTLQLFSQVFKGIKTHELLPGHYHTRYLFLLS